MQVRRGDVESREAQLDRQLAHFKTQDEQTCDWAVYYDLWVPTFDKGEYRHNGPRGGAHCLVACCADPTCLGIALESSEEYQCYKYSERPELLHHRSSRSLGDGAWLKGLPKQWSVFMKGPAVLGDNAQRTAELLAGKHKAASSPAAAAEQPEKILPKMAPASAAEKAAEAQASAGLMRSLMTITKLMDVREVVQVLVLVSSVVILLRMMSSNALVLKLLGQKFALDPCDEAKRLLKKQDAGTGAAAHEELSIADSVASALMAAEEQKPDSPGLQLSECVEPAAADPFTEAEKMLAETGSD